MAILDNGLNPDLPGYDPKKVEEANRTGSLSGTMVQPPPTTPPASPTQNSTSSIQSPTQSTQSNPFALAQVMQQLETQYKTNNVLSTQKNIALNALYGMPVSDKDLATLDPTLRKALQSGDKNQLEFQIRLMNDQISGRANTLDSSMQFLVQSYQQQQSNLEKQRADAISTVQQFVAQYGDQAPSALESLYGADYMNQLKSAGIDISKFAEMTVQQTDLDAIKAAKVSTPYANIGGKIVDVATGTGYTDPMDFQTKTGKTLQQAEREGLITKVEAPSAALKAGDTQTITANGRQLLINKLTGEVIQDFGSAYKGGGGGGSGDGDGEKWTVDSATDAILTGWTSEGYIQGNGKISSSDYKQAKEWWRENTNFASSTFDSKFGYLIDKSGENWREDYGYGL